MFEKRAAWARQLAREYEAIVWRQRLPPMRAALEVAPLESMWGQWRPERQCIVIACALVQLHPWEVVLEVLKHEMAHQLAEREVAAGAHPADDGRPHGEAFKRACARLAVAPWAQASRLSPLRPAPASSPGSRRLEKLKGLATSPNPHEAAAALAQARRLEASLAAAGEAAGHHLDEALDFLQICRRRRRIDRVDARLVALVVEHFAVQAVWVHTFDPVAMCHFRAVELMGRRRDLPFAAHVYHVVWAHLEAAWAKERQARPTTAAGGRSAFMLGMLQGLHLRLAREQAPRQGQPLGSELVALRHPARLDSFVSRRHPRVASLGRSGARMCPEAWAAGARAGERLEVHRPLAAARTTGPTGLRLPAPQHLLPAGR